MDGSNITGCELIARSIAVQGIRYVFTTPSSNLHPLLEALERQASVEVVAARSETAAAVMADG